MGKAAQPSTRHLSAVDQAAKPLNLLYRPWVICLVLTIVTVSVFWRVIGFDFINYDDPVYYSLNLRVLNGLSWSSFLWAFQTTALASLYPVTWLSFLVDATIFGRGPAGPHITNLVLHVVNTVLVFLLLRRLTGAHWRSAFVAA